MDLKQTVSEAIKDFKNHGFDNKTRLKRWQTLIKIAVVAALTKKIYEHSRRVLKQTYRKNIINGNLARTMGISTYKINKLKPVLLKELKKQQLACSDLIKSRRSEIIEIVHRRFTGWATSRYERSIDNVKLREIKSHIIKPVVQSHFLESRIIKDQNAKFLQNLTLIVGRENGAIAVQWEAFPERINYQHREAHLARQNKIYILRDNWAINMGLIRRGHNPFYDDIDQCGELPNCSCAARMIFNLDQLPDDLLTIKGREALRKG